MVANWCETKTHTTVCNLYDYSLWVKLKLYTLQWQRDLLQVFHHLSDVSWLESFDETPFNNNKHCYAQVYYTLPKFWTSTSGKFNYNIYLRIQDEANTEMKIIL